MHNSAATPLLFLGFILLISLVISPIANRFNIPRASLFIVCGLVIGQVSPEPILQLVKQWFSSIANVTLLIIGYLLGTRLTRDYLTNYAKIVSLSTFTIVLCTFGVVCLGLLLLGFPIEVAAIMASIALATDPAATLDVIKQSRFNNRFTKTLEGIVALDDAAALIVFSITLSILSVFNTNDRSLLLIGQMLWELIGAVVLGGGVGLLLVWLLNLKQYDITHTQSVLVESLGLILLTGGLAIYLELSFLLAAMVMGLVVVNFSDQSLDHLHELEYIEHPLLVLFFVLAGASVAPVLNNNLIWLLSGYVFLRIVGRFLGGYSIPTDALSKTNKKWLGIALLPQAGIAVGLALLAGQHFESHANTIISATITLTVLFEIVGPVLTSYALTRNKK
ncbi:cation:proton antiporter [Thalassotalea ponticola]|uniref:cation:proton antiporter n=1 Tax=Thalassotalea ponticola TaxID=1523392 RepID=UPI0025B2E155|nr:cation:proton antiporter [Thalassotalea ponticola]MDN3651180.1 cation:proton antiporter [Thalassotalea ponticola]